MQRTKVQIKHLINGIEKRKKRIAVKFLIGKEDAKDAKRFEKYSLMAEKLQKEVK